jgi:hypothetical protein
VSKQISQNAILEKLKSSLGSMKSLQALKLDLEIFGIGFESLLSLAMSKPNLDICHLGRFLKCDLKAVNQETDIFEVLSR